MDLIIFCLAVACLVLVVIADRGRRAALRDHATTIAAFRERAVIERQLWYKKGYQQAIADRQEALNGRSVE